VCRRTNNLDAPARRAFDRLGEADSIVIDPHKHGLQPYGCGCVLFKDPAVGRFYEHDSPYTYFTSEEMHLGEISLECSRPGAAAVALWATQKRLPLVKGGQFGAMLTQCQSAALALFEKLQADDRWLTAFAPELDIVVWLPRAARVSEVSHLARQVSPKRRSKICISPSRPYRWTSSILPPRKSSVMRRLSPASGRS